MDINLCHHLSFKKLGGGEKWAAEVARDFTKRGHNVRVYSTPIKVAGGAIADPKELLGDIPYVEKLRHTGISGDVNYVTYHPTVGYHFKTKGKKISGVHATTCWEPVDWHYGFLPIQARLMHNIFGQKELDSADAVHTVASYLDINHHSVYRIPNFVDGSRYVPCKKNEKFTVAFISRKSYQKGWDIFQEIKSKLPDDIEVRISGNISEEDIPRFIGESHVVVVPSRYDSFGLACVEPLLTETFVITSNLVSHHGLNLPLIYADSVFGYLKQIEWVKNIYKESPEYAKALRPEAMKYDKSIIIDKLENMFLEVANK